MVDVMSDEVRFYLERVAPGIGGWLHTVAQYAICTIDEIQRQSNICGDIVEIGVWEGRSSILLSLLSQDRNNVYEYDIEVKSKAVENIGKYAYNGGSNIKIIEKSSLDIDPLSIISQTGLGCRFFHVDGYHSIGVARSDLALAVATTQEKGVIALDDFYSATLPGVTEALYEIVLAGKNNGFFPFAIGGSKVYLCKDNMVDFYRDKMLARMPMSSVTSEETQDVCRMFDRVIAVYDLY